MALRICANAELLSKIRNYINSEEYKKGNHAFERDQETKVQDRIIGLVQRMNLSNSLTNNVPSEQIISKMDTAVLSKCEKVFR